MKIINGSFPLRQYKNVYRFNTVKKVLIIRFPINNHIKKEDILASEISTTEKISIMIEFSIKVNYHVFSENLTEDELVKYCLNIDQDNSIIGVIFQNPIPKRFHSVLKNLPFSKDLDAWSGKGICNDSPITVEAIDRIIKPFMYKQLKIGIVGYKGYIGSKLVPLVQSKFNEPILIDSNDDLSQLKKCDIVISSTGVGNLIKSEHLNFNALLGIDVGCTIDEDYRVIGDFSKKSIGNFKYFVPSPGGIGPLSMSILIERIKKILDNETLIQWRLNSKYEISI